ncbi:MAG TPA: CHAT domain-containing tetratricopeptide repeat protein [Pyrinomonadaceae bacterium]|nr:CHAT domain-containing tetratricopeptide repeat protein [Pyrinomonadaceae bacterium]
MSRPSPDLLCRAFSLSLAIVLLIAVAPKSSAAPSTQSQTAPIPLELSKPIERAINAGETHSYSLTLTAGQYAHITVDQRDVDVVVSIYTPDGTRVAQVDSPNGNYGIEPVSVIAETSGAYRVEVLSTSPKKPGKYEVKLEELRVVTANDRNRVAAQTLFTEAKALRNERTQESFQQAIKKYDAAFVIWQNLNDKLMEAFTLHEVGMIYGDTGQYQKAIDSHTKAAALYKELKLPRCEAAVTVNIGWIYGELGDTQNRLAVYDRAAAIYETVGDIDPVLISNFGSTYAKLGQYQRALDINMRVLEMRRPLQEPLGLGVTLRNIGDCYEHLGNKQKALDFYKESLGFMQKAGNHFYTASTLINLGLIYEGLKQDKALDYFNQALAIRRTINDERGIANALFYSARVERDRGNLSEARKRSEAALELIERLRTKVASQQLRASFFASVQQFREFYIDLLMRLHKENPSQRLDTAAFNASETGRARSLLELISEANTEIHTGVDPKLLERKQSLEGSIADKADSQSRTFSEKSPEERAAAAEELALLTTEYDQVQARIREASPQYAALIQPVPLKLEEIQKQVLDNDTLLLEYSLGEQKSFLWAVTPDSIKSYELPNRATIEPLARRVYELLTTRNQNVANETLEQRRQRLEAADAEYLKAAASLSQAILGPAAAELKNKRLLIVSDGVLQFVPFSGLPDPTNARPLMLDHELVTAPSTAVVALLRQETANRKPAPKTLAVFADPVFSTDDSRVLIAKRAHAAHEEKASGADAVRSASEVGLGDLRRLRFSRQEADAITRYATQDLKLEAVDFQANRTLATSAELGQYQIVHFATHGLINNTHPELSGVVLSLVDEKGRPQNGFLRLYDLYNLKLSADLVVLSACQTALGKEIRGEGLVGLTRGFMYAGAPRVVASLWQIDDRATAEFMKRFYEGMLGQKLRPAAALRAAQASMSKDPRWHEPHYWAAFTLQGEWK